jgi:hypothetical protein
MSTIDSRWLNLDPNNPGGLTAEHIPADAGERTIQQALDNKTEIDDAVTSLTKTWSSSRIAQSTGSGNLALPLTLGNEFGNVTIQENGTIRLYGSATSWDDLMVEARPGIQGQSTKPDWDNNYHALMFPQNNPSEIVTLNFQLPHRWKLGSTIQPHIHFLHNQNKIPIFKMQYRWYNIGDPPPASWTIYTMNDVLVPYPGYSIHNLCLNQTGIDGTGMGFSSLLQVKIYRDDNVFVGDCPVFGFDIHIEIDSFGTGDEFVK